MPRISKKNPINFMAGPASGCGKTTAVCAILTLLKRRGLRPVSLKCGPDYIDPMFHKTVTETDSANLDPFFFDDSTLNALLAENAEGHDIAVIEGVMGFYDGTGADGTENSTYSVARRTKSPVVLVMDGRGASVSVLAALSGFLDFMPENGIAGVLLSRVTPGTYGMLRRLAGERFGDRVRMLGYLPKLPEALSLGSRHLGLITADEVVDLREKLSRTADILSETVDIDALLALAGGAPPISFLPPAVLPEKPSFPSVRIAVARDQAFCFYYADNFRLLERLGAELVFFSPLADPSLPAGCAGLYLGGGYPELYKEKLSENAGMRASILAAIENGMPCVAECGGFLYLGARLDGVPMVGALASDGAGTGRLVRFGYITLTAKRDGLLLKEGESVRAHEFHYYDSTACGDGFRAEKQSGAAWDCVVTSKTLHAGYPHIHFWSNPETAASFIAACKEYGENTKRERDYDFARSEGN